MTLLYLLLGSLLLLRGAFCDTSNFPSVVRIGVLLPSINANGKTMNQPLQAVHMAADEINNDPNILPGIQVEVVFNDTTYDHWTTNEAAFWQVNAAQVVGIIGGSDASAVKTLSPVLTTAGIPLLSPSAVDYELSSSALFPTFFRICPNDKDLAIALHAFLFQYAWQRVAVIHSDDDYGNNGVRATINLAETLGFKILGAVFLKKSSGARISRDKMGEIRNLRKTGARIFIVVLPGFQLNAVLQTAREAGMMSVGYAWIILRCNYGVDLFDPEKMAGIVCITQHVDANSYNTFWEKLQSFSRSEAKSLWLESIYAYRATKALTQALHQISLSGNLNSGGLSTGFIPSVRPYGKDLVSQLMKMTFLDAYGTGTGNFSLSDQGLKTSSNYDFTFYQNGQLIKFAEWTDQYALKFGSELDRIVWPGGRLVVPRDKATEDDKDTLNVLVPMSWPFTGLTDPKTNQSCAKRPENERKKCQFVGVAVELLKRVTNSSRLKMKLNMTLWSGSWTEMVRLVGDETSPYDLACGSITVTSERLKIARFTRPFYESGLRFVVKRPEIADTGYFSFFKPFEWSVWLLMVVAFISAAIVLMYLDPEAVDTDSQRAYPEAEIKTASRKIHAWADAVYFSFCTAFYVHKAEDVTKLSAQIFVVVLSFFVFTIIAAYTANMAAFLTSRGYVTETLATYKELVNEPVGCRKGTSNWNFVRDDLNLGRHLVAVSGAEEAADFLKSGTISAYVGDTPHVMGLEAGDCDVVVVGRQEQEQVYAFPTKRSLSAAIQIDREITAAVKEEYVIKTFERLLDNTCPPLSLHGEQTKITLHDIGGLFILSVALAAFFLAVKGLLHARRRLKDVKKPFQTKNKSDLDDLDGAMGTYRQLLDGDSD